MVPPHTPDAVGGRPLAITPSLRCLNTMAWVYRVGWVIAVLPFFAWLWWRGLRDPDYRARWPERLAWTPVDPARRGGVLLHCASVGEVIAARPLIEALLARSDWGPLTVTCTTPTGSTQLRKDFGTRVGHCYFPLDGVGAPRRFLQHWRPRIVILLEREIWPTFLHAAQTLGVPVVLANGRLSARSAALYQRWPSLSGPALAALQMLCVENEETAQRFRRLGVRTRRLVVTGNIKSDVYVGPVLHERMATLRATLGTRKVLTAGSTHAGEDEALVPAFATHLQHAPGSLLILVPRHPERFDTVARLLQQAGLRFARHSQGQAVSADTQVLLGDTMGDLMLWYGVADACFVGGSLIPRGGHNPLEPLHLDRPLIVGSHTANFDALYRRLGMAGAMLLASDAADVLRQFERVLQLPQETRAMVQRARVAMEGMRGASARTVEALHGMASLRQARLPEPEPRTARIGADTVWVDPAVFPEAHPNLFDPAWWQESGSATAHGAGRGKLHRVSDGRATYLLRHYYRGGLMARINRDLFLAQPVADSRAMAEFTLLRALRQRGLPVPRACAALHRSAGVFYRADILIEWIAQATDIAALLHTVRRLGDGEWQRLGEVVRQLHDAQVFHADLNCHNLMLDTHGNAWIVDFDKCAFRAGAAWKSANLERLLRSLRKERRLNPSLHWDEAQWQNFLAGYQVV